MGVWTLDSFLVKPSTTCSIPMTPAPVSVLAHLASTSFHTVLTKQPTNNSLTNNSATSTQCCCVEQALHLIVHVAKSTTVIFPTENAEAIQKPSITVAWMVHLIAMWIPSVTVPWMEWPMIELLSLPVRQACVSAGVTVLICSC